MSKKILKCGCAPNAYDGETGKGCCIIHNCYEEMNIQPDLTGRIAKCEYCSKKMPSSTDLPFFSYHPDKEYDNYYCGCMGWD